ncbi:helix-turn-helix domain-containing protein [Endozoicomonas acroporae]|uniref:helix-turn-helix domain-containing protein n=1 Tax=Endozoicomonas acroporae TaxID=1701104 RepID=UPI0013D00005|nr:helix-turn-helix domain-containing protein [Endozoicomonas acroporae]
MTGRKTNSELHERIKFIRKILKLSQEDLGNIAEVSRVAVSQWESRDPDKRTAPNTDRLKVISEATGFPYTWIIDDASELEVPESLAESAAAGALAMAKTVPFVGGLVSQAIAQRESKKAPIIDRIQQASETIAELSPDGGSDEVLLSSLQILVTYRRALQEANRKK